MGHHHHHTSNSLFSVFISLVIKIKNLNHSVNKFKTLGYDRGLKYKQPCQESGLCRFSFARYSQKCVTHFYRVFFMETPGLCPLEIRRDTNMAATT